jgi:ABC-2 type transport system permease protein
LTGFLPILKRELKSLWVTPLAWVLLTTFLLLQGGIFYAVTVHISGMEDAALEASPLEAYFGRQSLLMSLTLLLLCPGLTMRVLAEERRSGSIEALLSAPVTSAGIVVGKYAAVLLTYLAIWAPTTLYVVLLRGTGVIHVPTVISSYLGVVLIGSSYLAIGVLMSSLAKSQLIALFLTIFALFGLFVLGLGEYVFEGSVIQAISSHLSLTTLLEETSKGLIDSRRLVLHSSVVAWCLFVTTRVVDSWRSA